MAIEYALSADAEIDLGRSCQSIAISQFLLQCECMLADLRGRKECDLSKFLRQADQCFSGRYNLALNRYQIKIVSFLYNEGYIKYSLDDDMVQKVSITDKGLAALAKQDTKAE